MIRICLGYYLLIATITLAGCNSAPDKEKSAGSTHTTGTTAAATDTEFAMPDESVLLELQKILAKGDKVEYMLYDLGISFESPNPGQSRTFPSFMERSPANGVCKSGKYDGGIVFKSQNGDILLEMEINVPQVSKCNRMVYAINGKKYAQSFNQNGLSFFNQVLNLRTNAVQGQ